MVCGCLAALLDVVAGKQQKPCWKRDITRALQRLSSFYLASVEIHVFTLVNEP